MTRKAMIIKNRSKGIKLLIKYDGDDGKKPIKKKPRGMTLKAMIIKNRSKGIKVLIKYNQDGIYVGDSSVHLTS